MLINHLQIYLSIFAQVEVNDLKKYELTPNDVIIMGSDGLWDVITNTQAIEVVQGVLTELPSSDNSR